MTPTKIPARDLMLDPLGRHVVIDLPGGKTVAGQVDFITFGERNDPVTLSTVRGDSCEIEPDQLVSIR